MDCWESLTLEYKGWTLHEVKALSPRERHLWLTRAVARKAKRD